MVSKTTVLIVGYHKQDLVPLRAAAESVVHLAQEFLATVNWARGMETVIAAALGILEAERRCQSSTATSIMKGACSAFTRYTN
jgi:hypothetical protein